MTEREFIRAGLSIAHALNTINEHSVRYLTHEISAEQFAEETLRALEICSDYLAANNGAKS